MLPLAQHNEVNLAVVVVDLTAAAQGHKPVNSEDRHRRARRSEDSVSRISRAPPGTYLVRAPVLALVDVASERAVEPRVLRRPEHFDAAPNVFALRQHRAVNNAKTANYVVNKERSLRVSRSLRLNVHRRIAVHSMRVPLTGNVLHQEEALHT